MPPKHTPSSKSAGKRRKRVSSDDNSDVEIVDPPPVEDGESPSRSVRKKLPAVSVIDAIDTMIHGQGETSPLPTRSARVHVKTEKGHLLAATPLKTQRQKKVVVPSPVISESDSDLPEFPTMYQTTKKPRISSGISNGGDTIMPNSGHESNPTNLSGKIIAALKVTNMGSPGSTDEDSNNNVTTQGTTIIDEEFPVAGTRGFRGPVSPASSNMGDKEPANNLDDGVQSLGSESEEQSETVSDIVEKNTSAAWDGPSTADTASEIMDISLQHPDLRVLYEHLPHLPSFCDIRVWNYPRGPEMLERVDFEQLKPVLSARTTTLLFNGLNFTQCGHFVNMARVDPKRLALSADKHRIVIAGGGDINAVGIMSGRISACDVVNAYTSVSRDGGSCSLRRVILSPWAQELRRETSMWGLKLGFKTIMSSACEDGLSFNSRRKTAYSGSSAPSTPKKPRSRFSMSLKNPSITAAPDGYPLSRGFDESIPLYDGRAGRGSPFTFSDADFTNLSQWPLYKKGQADLPVDSMVVVGYTVSLYEWPVGSKDDQLSTNLQFVILLGIPVDPPA